AVAGKASACGSQHAAEVTAEPTLLGVELGQKLQGTFVRAVRVGGAVAVDDPADGGAAAAAGAVIPAALTDESPHCRHVTSFAVAPLPVVAAGIHQQVVAIATLTILEIRLAYSLGQFEPEAVTRNQ